MRGDAGRSGEITERLDDALERANAVAAAHDEDRLAVSRELQLAGELPIHSQRCEETLLTAAVEPAESRCLRSAAAVQKAGRTGSPYCRT